MGWWTTIVNGAQIAQDTITNGAKLLWNWTYTPIAAVATFATDTVVALLEQGIAVTKSIPALASPESVKIVKAAANITAYQIMPLILINMANTSLQMAVKTGYEQEEDQTLMYNALMLPAATAIDWAVWAWTTQRSSHMLAQTLVIDTMGAAAFNTTKPKSKDPTPCEDEGCTLKRRVKGSLREFFVLFLYDVLTGGVSYLPYCGESISLILKVGFAGDLIARGGMLDLCERHRVTSRAKVWSLGFTHVLMELLTDRALASTVGMPPYAVHRTIRHMLMLFSINNATHMKIDYVAPGKAALLDPVIIYGKASSILADIIITGSKEEFAKLFQPRPNKEPIISIPAILKRLTDTLNSDLERINQPKPMFLKTVAQKITPSIYYDSKAAVNDPVLRIFWPDIRDFAEELIELIKAAGIPVANLTTTHVPLVAGAIKKILPKLLYQQYGISKKVTTFLINLCEDEDFWKFVQALQQWLQRHDLREKPPLAIASDAQLSSLYETKSNQPPKLVEEQEAKPKLLTLVSTGTPSRTALAVPCKQNTRALNPNIFHRQPKNRNHVQEEATPPASLSSLMQDHYF